MFYLHNANMGLVEFYVKFCGSGTMDSVCPPVTHKNYLPTNITFINNCNI